jgi:hypothetical protein
MAGPGEHLAVAGVDDRSQRRVLPRARDADARDGAGAGLDPLLQRPGQVIPRDALFHSAPHVVSKRNRRDAGFLSGRAGHQPEYGWSMLALHAHIVSSVSVSATDSMALRRPSTPSVIW